MKAIRPARNSPFVNRSHERPAFRGDPERFSRIGYGNGSGSADVHQFIEPNLPRRFFRRGQRVHIHQGVVQFFGVANQRPGFGGDLRDDVGVEFCEIAKVIRIERTASRHRPRAPFFERAHHRETHRDWR